MKRKRVTWPQTRAFSVHLLTASGSFLAFLSLVAASEQRWTAMFWWLGLALLVDGIDGPIARKLQVKEILPNWSGIMLDNVIDYVTYVLIPAFALYQRGFMGPGLSFTSAAIIVISSAIYYADTGMKTKENFFKGFPVVWNMLVFTLFVMQPGQYASFVVVVVAAALTFVPVYFLHPVRVVRLRELNLSVFALWCIFAAVALLQEMDAAHWIRIGIAAAGAYLFFVGAVMQLFPNLGRKEVNRMTKAIVIERHGGPEVMRYEDVDVGAPGPGQVRMRHTAIGLNFLDTYYRTGLYAAPNGLPLIPGNEAAGIVLELGAGVDGLKPGDRVAYAGPLGAYAEERLFPADQLVRLPDAVSDEQAAAIMLKGMTVWYLLRRTFRVQPGNTVLFHAAAGGVGLIFGPWAKHLGATVIGTAGSPGKVELARRHGYDHVINYREQDFVAEVGRLTGGRKLRRRLRRRRQGHFPGLARLHQADGHVRQLRPVFGPGPAVSGHAAFAEGLAVCHATHDLPLYRRTQGAGCGGRRAVRRGGERHRQGRDQPAPTARGGGHGPCRARSAQDDGGNRSGSLKVRFHICWFC